MLLADMSCCVYLATVCLAVLSGGECVCRCLQPKLFMCLTWWRAAVHGCAVWGPRSACVSVCVCGREIVYEWWPLGSSISTKTEADIGFWLFRSLFDQSLMLPIAYRFFPRLRQLFFFFFSFLVFVLVCSEDAANVGGRRRRKMERSVVKEQQQQQQPEMAVFFLYRR